MRKLNSICLVILLLILSNQAMSQKKYVVDANKSYFAGKYFEAAGKCTAAFTKLGTKGSIKDKADMAFKAAECFRLTDKVSDAQTWYEKAIELKYYDEKPEVYFYNGEMLRMQADNEKAIKNYKLYQKLNPSDKRTQVSLDICEQNEKFKLKKTKYVISHEQGLSKKEMDMAPMFADKDQNLIIFGSSRKGSVGEKADPITGESYMDLWMSAKDKKGNWQEPVLLDKGLKVNTGDNEGTISFDAQYKTAFITRCPTVRKQNLGCQIMVAEMKGLKYDKGGGKWDAMDTFPIKQVFKLNDSVSLGHPCVSKDEKMLIFASDASEINGIKSYGGRDLWSVNFVQNKKKKTYELSNLKNMGPKINTPANELFPTLGTNGDLFFASDGHPGFGGLDIFVVAKDSLNPDANSWPGDPENLGSPINSQSNDYAIYDNNRTTGYFTSERKSPNGENTPDIYSYNLPEVKVLFDLNVIVYDRKSKARLEGASVYLTEVDGDFNDEKSTNAKGKTGWEKDGEKRIIIGNKTYKITASKEGYVNDVRGTVITTVGLTASKSFTVEISLLPMRDIVLNEVLYVINQWVFVNDEKVCNSADSLKAVKEELDQFPNVVIKIFSHTDSRNTDEKNQTLSENRARAYYSALVDLGIDPRRIIPEGRGEKEPRKWIDEEGKEVLLTEEYINTFKSDNKKYEKLHQLNRRTTAEVVRQDFDSAKETMTIEEAKKKYNYKSYLKY
jgi:outer membrane protein OmpA-like peptidoglycan-associated protein/tetratricopeptide (TPR) repeat protein